MFNLFVIFIVLLCYLVNPKDTIIFPQNRFQIFQQKWGSCYNSSTIQPQINQFEQPIQIPITHDNPLCLHELLEFSLSEPISFYYFVFNRIIDQNDLLIIKIDGEKYTITQETVTDKFVLIRHKRLCSYNSIEFYLKSNSQDLALQNYLILISNIQSGDYYNQVLGLSYLNIGEEYQITQYNLQTKNQKIFDSILSYEGLLSFENLESVGSCLDFDVYNFNRQMKCNNKEIGKTIRFECKLDIQNIQYLSQIKDLSFLIQSQYTFRFQTPCFPNIPNKYITFQTIQQIDDNKYQTANHIQEQQFGIQHQINLIYYPEIEQIDRLLNITLYPIGSSQCVEFEEAFLTLKNSLGETVKCELSNDSNCLTIQNCSFYFNFDFQDNVGYIFNLTAIIKKATINSPCIQFVLVDIVLKESIQFQEPDYNFTFIAILIIFSLGLPIICFILSTFMFKVSLYNSWLREIYIDEQDALKT